MASPSRSATATIAGPPATVFAILSDPRQHPRIDGSGTVRGAVAGPERLELGSEFGMDMKMGAPYRITNRVVEFDEDRLIAWRHQGRHRWRYELTPTADGGTRVVETWDLSRYPGVVARAFDLVLGGRTQRSIESTLANLKDAAEADSA